VKRCEVSVRWTTRGVGRYLVSVRLPGHPGPLLSLGPLHELQEQVDRLLGAWGVGAGVRALGAATERALRAQVERWLGPGAADWPLESSGRTTLGGEHVELSDVVDAWLGTRCPDCGEPLDEAACACDEVTQ
jgi:hypothetical protein